ncbi:MAG TPA: hypothetical protein VKR26_15250, partial [Terriglobales bacterium]|nr:hypothetical protein [Terriglobales bacterium]
PKSQDFRPGLYYYVPAGLVFNGRTAVLSQAAMPKSQDFRPGLYYYVPAGLVLNGRTAVAEKPGVPSWALLWRPCGTGD